MEEGLGHYGQVLIKARDLVIQGANERNCQKGGCLWNCISAKKRKSKLKGFAHEAVANIVSCFYNNKKPSNKTFFSFVASQINSFFLL